MTKVSALTQETARELIADARQELIQLLIEYGPNSPTLCEGWQTRHMVAHLLLRESRIDITAGVAGGPLAQRADRITNQLADTLVSVSMYEDAVNKFAHLKGLCGIRTRAPKADRGMNQLEYFIHSEDIRRANNHIEPRQLSTETQVALWSDLCKRAKMMVGKNYPQGLVIESLEFTPAAHTVVAPQPGSPATIVSGAPGEIALYLFGRQEVAQVRVH